jgi:hypothetical protein
MIATHRIVRCSAALALAAVAACSSERLTSAAPHGPSLAKSGTVASGGGSSGGNTGGGGSTTPSSPSSPSSPSGPPVAPSYTARIDSISNVPTALYYGQPSSWIVGGYLFQANSATHLKAAAGPLVVGACATVSFYDDGLGGYIMTELKTVDPSKCSD